MRQSTWSWTRSNARSKNTGKNKKTQTSSGKGNHVAQRHLRTRELRGRPGTGSVRTENYFVKPMSVDEAAMQMDLSQQEFLVFQQRVLADGKRALSEKRRQLRSDSSTEFVGA